MKSYLILCKFYAIIFVNIAYNIIGDDRNGNKKFFEEYNDQEF